MAFEIALPERDPHPVDVVHRADRAVVAIDGRDYHGSLRPAGDAYELTLEDRAEPVWILVDRDLVHVHAFGQAWTLVIVDPVERSRAGAESEDLVKAPMPGTVLSVAATAGQEIRAGEQVLVIESMKMQSEIIATRDGVVGDVFVAVGDTFGQGAPLFALEPEAEED